ncbi:SIMPL domain-containing protein [Breoghania sp.]|uniref:SIMPL domain-containing protein n=1 Tax=Breoghania sp. TaxID=2065378 RepID=UPI0029C9E861|nr:SIMPL domain-containing protein [Breoghania sp.]
MSSSFRPLAATLMLASLVAFANPAWASDEQKTATMSLNGYGEVTATPDMAMVTSGVVSQADTARDALTANTKAMTALIDQIKKAGIEARDIQTSGFSISPRYAQKRLPKDGSWQEERKIVGYQVNNGVSVRVRDLKGLGALLDAMVSEGANRIGGINFIVSDANKRLDEARTAAVEDVQGKAKLYAEAAGVKLGRILSISENSYGMRPQPMLMNRAKVMAEGAPVPVEAGEETLRSEVTITWELKD